jgi:hypothetical protein
MKCGKDKKNALGICPAVTETEADGVNCGKNGGRVCWAISGTLGDDRVQGTYAQKLLCCSYCEFRMLVQEEEHIKFRRIYLKT